MGFSVMAAERQRVQWEKPVWEDYQFVRLKKMGLSSKAG